MPGDAASCAIISPAAKKALSGDTSAIPVPNPSRYSARLLPNRTAVERPRKRQKSCTVSSFRAYSPENADYAASPISDPGEVPGSSSIFLSAKPAVFITNGRSPSDTAAVVLRAKIRVR